ncbi:MAG: cell division protein FtsL [Ignavibacterium sp.]|nr:MAG: cell division protein FtsL [Ignavibacterium sp.]
MKKSAKPLIVVILILLLTETAIVLVTIGLRFKYEELVRDKVKLEKILNDERTKKVNLIAEYQSFSSDERIISFAEEKLGLKKLTDPKITVTVNKNHINKLNSELKRKYD